MTVSYIFKTYLISNASIIVPRLQAVVFLSNFMKFDLDIKPNLI